MKKTKSKKLPSVTITLDGLMLFCFDKAKSLSEVKFRRVDEHKAKIKVEKKNDPDYEKKHKWTHSELIRYHQLWLHKARNGTPPYEGTAVQGEYYNDILAIDGQDFYGQELSRRRGSPVMRRGRYHPTLYICDGIVGTDKILGEKGCHRVTHVTRRTRVGGRLLEYSFNNLRYQMSEDEWEELKANFKDQVKPLQPFSRWVNATIKLAKGESLLLTGVDEHGKAHQEYLIKDYNVGDTYWIYISHLDRKKPKSLGDCKGLGHLCESFELGRAPLYSVFVPTPDNPLRLPTAPWNELGTRTSDITCCKTCRVSAYVG